MSLGPCSLCHITLVAVTLLNSEYCRILLNRSHEWQHRTDTDSLHWSAAVCCLYSCITAAADRTLNFSWYRFHFHCTVDGYIATSDRTRRHTGEFNRTARFYLTCINFSKITVLYLPSWYPRRANSHFRCRTEITSPVRQPGSAKSLKSRMRERNEICRSVLVWIQIHLTYNSHFLSEWGEILHV